MWHLYQLSFILTYFVFHLLLNISSSSQLCHHQEMMALLHFKDEFTISPLSSQYDGYPKTKLWKDNIDCCMWSGVTCDSISGHVIKLDISSSQLGGVIHPNSSIFYLSYLETLNLAYNDFKSSHISQKFGHFSSLKVLNLSNSNLIGDVPAELGLLSRLVSLDLSNNGYVNMPYFNRIMKNLTNLKQLHLGGVLINSSIPHTLANLSRLTSLNLSNCNLQGIFPRNVLKLPHLRSLIVSFNPNLTVNPLQFTNLSSSLEVVHFSSTNISGTLPEFSLGSEPPRLREIFLDHCNLYGSIPTWIWNMKVISLGSNQFTGRLPLTINTKVLSELTTIDLSYNLLEGPVPSFFFTLPSLKYLHLGSNNFSGKFGAFAFPISNTSLEFISLGGNNLNLDLNVFRKMKNLTYLDLSYNGISLTGSFMYTYSWPNLSYLFLRSCNISKFPDFSSSKRLEILDLSNNKIQGEIPTWLYSVGKNSLTHLNISHNNLTGSFELSSWKNIFTVDVGFNSLQGMLPLPPPSTSAFLAPNNQFQGEMYSFCNLTLKLAYLDLSNNRLSGQLPKCLGKLSHGLKVLDLGSNLFQGVIFMVFKNDCTLISLHLDNNSFEGKVPQSIMRCKGLQVLNIGINQFNGSFPHQFGTLQELRVFVLKSNNFKSTIDDQLKRYKHPFPKLQILCLSGNQFYGKLPVTYFANFKALMVNDDGGNKSLKYFGNFAYYHETLVLTAKGMTLTYKLLSILAALDFSDNRFSGEIPDSIGQLNAVLFLNVSYNQLIGHIPPSLANMNSLESLDLSHNKLGGNIPPQLVRLTFLEKFIVSYNQLVGPIPLGSQFSTFSSDSYEGNPGLCGDPLPMCGTFNYDPGTPKSQYDYFDITSVSLWEIILIGFGFGTILGFISGGYMLYTVRPAWFSEKVEKLEYYLVKSFDKHSRLWERSIISGDNILVISSISILVCLHPLFIICFVQLHAVHLAIVTYMKRV